MASVRAASELNKAPVAGSAQASISANIASVRSGSDKSEEHPAALLAPLEHPGIGEDLQMARNPRLALSEDLRQLAHGQLDLPQQCDDAQPRRVGERLETVGERGIQSHELRI